MACPVLFGISDNRLCISLRNYGWLPVFVKRFGFPVFEADARALMQSADPDFRFALIIPTDLISSSNLGLHLKILSNPRNEIETQTVNGILQKTIFSNVPELLGQSLQARAKDFLGDARLKQFNGAIAGAVSSAFGGNKAEIEQSMASGDFGLGRLTKPVDPTLRRLDTPTPATNPPATPVTPSTNPAADAIAKIIRLETEQVVGADAPGYRVTYQAEGTRRERFERALRGLFPGVELRSQRIEGLTTYGEPVRIHYEADVPQFAQVDADGLRLRGTVLDELTRSLAGTETRRHPLDLSGTSSYTEERRVRLPTGMRILQLPAGGEARSPFGHLEVRYEDVGGREVVVRTTFAVTRDRIAQEEYVAFRHWVERADDLLRQRIALGVRR